jgi:pyruvate carboxylase
MQKITKLLVANRGEIAIRILRAASELQIRTVAIYTYEDRYSLHRYKADEAYQIGKNDEALSPYLDVEAIIQLAKHKKVDAIHPGYGFLSENVNLARRCQEEGIVFVGPRPEVMEALGDKVAAKKIALEAGVPMIEDSKAKLTSVDIVKQEALRIGYPVMLKAAAGGGGRGMRVVREEKDIEKSFQEARSEAGKAFGDDTIFMEKFIDSPKHIEVQILGDNFGNIVHLFERDCSVQRRFQKVVEVAPAPTLQQETKDKLYEYALKIARTVEYNNAGTVEFLVDAAENVFFIEVNPRVQVEHTITEEITGIDIVRSQILIASGSKLSDRGIYILDQSNVKINGFAIQCRITTEDPSNGFKPDYGTIIAYRNAAGFGIRLDEGSSYPGVKVSPYFDSMLVKVSARARTLKGACQRMDRALREFRIRGVKTNISFLQNVIAHPVFQKGEATVKFIESYPELLKTKTGLDRGTKNLLYLANVVVNGHPDVKNPDKKRKFRTPQVPDYDMYGEFPKGTKDKLTELGREGFIEWLKKENAIQYTDTTFRDGHQSLLATRVRTLDMLKVAESFAKNHPQVFSMEVWGGATFDVSMRFLHESPWQRLQAFRKAIPNILLQMLIRGSNAVGYSAYPDNLIEKFIEKAAENGIDIFRIFDSLNWIDSMLVSIKAIREQTNSLAEACICYTNDILNPDNKKYTLQYYVDMAKKLEDAGAHILGIKDMAGLLKPFSAELLVTELRKHISLPIHLHTHDTSSIQAATYLKAIEAGVDVVDLAIGSMSGLTSQPNFNSVVAMMQHHKREQPLDLLTLNKFSAYWEDVREMYYPFESDLKAGTAEVYDNEIPGGQYSNLRPQAEALGVGDKFDILKKNYAIVNKMFGDIVKVTPSSKVVGDMALFMTSNDLSEQDIYEKGNTLSFPESVKSLFKGELGQPYQGFPAELQKIILKGEAPLAGRPNDNLKPIDFTEDFNAFTAKFPDGTDFLDYLSYKMYPKVFEDYYKFRQEFEDVRHIPTPAFFYGLQPNEEIIVDFEDGKSLMIRLLFVQEPDELGMRRVSFELNGQQRILNVKDTSFKATRSANRKVASKSDIGSPLQGRLTNILVKAGDVVKENTPLFVIEAMKMETVVAAPFAGTIKTLVLQPGTIVEQDDAVLEFV